MINLPSNAIKYNRPGGSIDITVSIVDKGLVFNVTDTGIGIPAEDLPKLFSPFERLGRQRGDVEGSDIGLALAKRLATAGGELDLVSTHGEGSTFTLTMPITTGTATKAGGIHPSTGEAIAAAPPRRDRDHPRRNPQRQRQPQQIERLLTAGAEHYLTKPLDISELLALLNAHAGVRSSPRI